MDYFYKTFLTFFLEPGKTTSVICQQVDGKSLAFLPESVLSKPCREKLTSKQTTIAMSFAFALFISWNRQNFGILQPFFSLSKVICICLLLFTIDFVSLALLSVCSLYVYVWHIYIYITTCLFSLQLSC